MKLFRLALLGMLFAIVQAMHAQDYYQNVTLEDGTSITYALLLPPKFEAGVSYPTLLALPPGPQTKDMVEAGLGYWRSGPERGWVVISPVAPGPLFFQGAEVHIPALLEQVAQDVTFESDKVHVAGISNGGRSAFRIALKYPDLVHSLLVLPGFPPSEADFKQLERIKALPTVMYAGELDTGWVEQMMSTEAALKDLGADVTATVVEDEGHVIRSLSPEALFGVLDGFR